MKGIRHALETAIKHDKLADLYRKIAQERTEEEVGKLKTKVDKLNFVHETFEGFDKGREVSLSYNLRVKIERGEV